MCGIIGYIGRKVNIKTIIQKLKLLEYRGYDSSGVYAFDGKNELLLKSVGNISKLEEIIPKTFKSGLSMAHTRWATHGIPSKENTHPHFSNKGEWGLVHNGIIENYLEIKDKLLIKPNSETDTAILAQYLEENNIKNIDEFIDCFKSVDGSYAIVAIKKDQESLYLAKNQSPLYIASINESFIVSSDPICFINEIQSYYSLNDNEFALIDKNKITFYDKNKKIMQKTKNILKKSLKNTEKIKFNHFMIKEIFEQKQSINNFVKYYKSKNLKELVNEELIKNIKKIKIIGCGTAYHSGLIGARYIEMIANIPSESVISSEFVYNMPKFIDKNTLIIAVSQSGETADTLKAVEIARSCGAKIIGITNVEHSTLTTMVDLVVPICAGYEKAVASTKAYTGQLCAFYLLANQIYNLLNNINNEYLNDLKLLSNEIFSYDENLIKNIAEDIKNKKECVFIGKDLDYISAKEAELKLKEVSYINATSYPSGELKHGFLAIIEEGTPLFVFATNKELNKKTFNAVREAESRGAKIYIITNEDIEEKNAQIIKIKCKNKFLTPISAIIPMQQLAYEVSIKKHINPDQPRNLAKSVTVE